MNLYQMSGDTLQAHGAQLMKVALLGPAVYNTGNIFLIGAYRESYTLHHHLSS